MFLVRRGSFRFPLCPGASSFAVSEQQHPARTRRRRYHELCYDAQAPKGTPVHQRLHYRQEPTLNDVGEERADIQDHPHVRMIASPWNPADHMTVLGRYPSPSRNERKVLSRPIAGHEGWGQLVLDPGGACIDKEATWVVPDHSGLGTYRSHIPLTSKHSNHHCTADDWIPLPRGSELYQRCGPTAPASLFQTAGTAIRMLQEREDATVILQNAAASAVGLMVSQWAIQQGRSVISLVRQGPHRTRAQAEALMDEYYQFCRQDDHRGRLVVLLEEDIAAAGSLSQLLNDEYSDLPRPSLALNAVGGTSAAHLIEALDDGGTLITYGNLAHQQKEWPSPAYAMLFRNIQLRGYWHSRWMRELSSRYEREQLMTDIVNGVLDHGLQCPPHDVWGLKDYAQALSAHQQQASALPRKVVWDCRCDSELGT